jgi:hypothetical protein
MPLRKLPHSLHDFMLWLSTQGLPDVYQLAECSVVEAVNVGRRKFPRHANEINECGPYVAIRDRLTDKVESIDSATRINVFEIRGISGEATLNALGTATAMRRLLKFLICSATRDTTCDKVLCAMLLQLSEDVGLRIPKVWHLDRKRSVSHHTQQPLQQEDGLWVGRTTCSGVH